MKKTLFLLSFALAAATCLPQAAAEETTYTEDNWPESSTVQPAPTDAGNTITVSGVSDTNGMLYGGYSDDPAEVANNKVSVENSSTLDTVTGGASYGDSALVRKNSVTISGSTATSATGGNTDRGTCKENTATATDMATVESLYGALSGSDGSCEGNIAEVKGASTVTGDVSGGYSAYGSADRNTVNISGNSQAKYVYGGVAENGTSACGNTVTLDNATATGSVYGGYATFSDEGTANGNTVTIKNSTVTGTVYGGRGKAEARDNGIILEGTSDLSGATLLAASSSSAAGRSGNYLTLDGFTGTVKGVRNVDILNINLSTWDTEVIALALTDGNSTLNQLTLNFNILNWTGEESGEMTLVSGLKEEAGIASWNFTTGDGTATMSADSPVNVKVVENGGLYNVVAYVSEGSGSSASIPEPTTATLSLLALAGLAARRRRK